MQCGMSVFVNEKAYLLSYLLIEQAVRKDATICPAPAS